MGGGPALEHDVRFACRLLLRGQHAGKMRLSVAEYITKSVCMPVRVLVWVACACEF